MPILPGQEYVACDRSGFRYRVDTYQPGNTYVQVTDLTDGTRRQVKPGNLHTDRVRRTGYLLADLVDASWEADPRTRCAMYRAHTARTADRDTEK